MTTALIRLFIVLPHDVSNVQGLNPLSPIGLIVSWTTTTVAILIILDSHFFPFRSSVTCGSTSYLNHFSELLSTAKMLFFTSIKVVCYAVIQIFSRTVTKYIFASISIGHILFLIVKQCGLTLIFSFSWGKRLKKPCHVIPIKS